MLVHYYYQHFERQRTRCSLSATLSSYAAPPGGTPSARDSAAYDAENGACKPTSIPIAKFVRNESNESNLDSTRAFLTPAETPDDTTNEPPASGPAIGMGYRVSPLVKLNNWLLSGRRWSLFRQNKGKVIKDFNANNDDDLGS